MLLASSWLENSPPAVLWLNIFCHLPMPLDNAVPVVVVVVAVVVVVDVVVVVVTKKYI